MIAQLLVYIESFFHAATIVFIVVACIMNTDRRIEHIAKIQDFLSSDSPHAFAFRTIAIIGGLWLLWAFTLGGYLD